jgi:hypothetical protein
VGAPWVGATGTDVSMVACAVAVFGAAWRLASSNLCSSSWTKTASAGIGRIPPPIESPGGGRAGEGAATGGALTGGSAAVAAATSASPKVPNPKSRLSSASPVSQCPIFNTLAGGRRLGAGMGGGVGGTRGCMGGSGRGTTAASTGKTGRLRAGDGGTTNGDAIGEDSPTESATGADMKAPVSSVGAAGGGGGLGFAARIKCAEPLVAHTLPPVRGTSTGTGASTTTGGGLTITGTGSGAGAGAGGAAGVLGSGGGGALPFSFFAQAP